MKVLTVCYTLFDFQVLLISREEDEMEKMIFVFSVIRNTISVPVKQTVQKI